MKQLMVNSSPHIRGRWITSSVMRDVILALVPAMAAGIWIHGIRALGILLITVSSCVVTEAFCTRQAGIHGAEVITGILLGMSLPVSVPYWIPMVGGVFSVLVVKHLCGGMGKNVFNPVLVSRAFLLLVWPVYLTQFPAVNMEGVTSSTPLHHMQIPALPEETIWDLFFGTIPGCIGETSKAALLFGAAYLLWKGVIRPQIPLSYLGTVALLTLLFPQDQPRIFWMMSQLLSGSLILGAFYMATDYVTSPVTSKGRIAFGIGCGLFTVLFRYFGLYPEGVTYGILCMNPIAWSLDRWLAPRVFGHERRKPWMRKSVR